MKYFTKNINGVSFFIDENKNIKNILHIHCILSDNDCMYIKQRARGLYIEICVKEMICPSCGDNVNMYHHESEPAFMAIGSYGIRKETWFYEGKEIFELDIEE